MDGWTGGWTDRRTEIAIKKGVFSHYVSIMKTSRLVVLLENQAGNTATEVACGWAGAIFEVTRPFGQEQ